MNDMPLFESMIFALKKAGLRITRQRKEILKFIIENRSHLDAEVILNELTKLHITISRATIYRTLDVLVQQDIIDKYDFGDGKNRYEISAGQEHHDHLVCIKCNRIIEFKNSLSESTIPNICNKHTFKYLNHSIQIYGICSKCLKN